MNRRKVALCLSGQPRSVSAGFEYHKRNLLDHHDVDVFIHTWHARDESARCEAENLYEPISVGVDIPFPATYINRRYTHIANPQFPAVNTYSMWYSVFKANELRKLYTLHDGVEYDVVVRSRFDYALNRTLDLDRVEKHTLYVSDEVQTTRRDFCSDMFAWGSPETMDCYSGVFQNIDYFYSFGLLMNGEDMLRNQLYMTNLTGQNLEYVDMNNPFPPGKYNGNRHAIIRDDFTDWNKLR